MLKLRSLGIVFLLLFIQLGNREIEVPVAVIQWSPKGDLFAFAGGPSGCAPEDGDKMAIYIFDASTKALINTLVGSKCRVVSITWNSDGTKLAASGMDTEARIWDVESGTLLTQTQLGSPGRGEIIWSPDGTKLANILGETALFEIWDAQSGETLKLLGRSPYSADNNVLSVSWHPDGNQIVAGGILFFDNPDGFVRVWDVNTEVVTQEFEHPGGVYSVVWKPDGTQIASGSGNNEIRIWDARSRELVQTLEGDGGKLKWHPFKDIIAGRACCENSRITIWDTKSGEVIQEYESDGWTPVFEWSPYGGQLMYTLTEDVAIDMVERTFTEDALVIVVPDATLENVRSIAAQCGLDRELEEAALPALIADLKTLPQDACRADLIAVAEAVIAER